MRHPLLRSTLLLASLAVTLFVIAIVVFPGFFGISAMPAGEAAEQEVEGTATVTVATPTTCCATWGAGRACSATAPISG